MTPELIARYDQRVPRYTSYPTAPQFSDSLTPDIYRAWLAALDPAEPVSIYLHVPFCSELCWYCGCHTTVARGYSAIAHYTRLLQQEITLVAEALPQGTMVSHIHWGGGTPTILDPQDMLSVMTLLQTRFRFLPQTQTAVEIDPRVLTPAHVDAMVRGGLTRASLGVQDFNPTVQESINRVQSFETTQNAMRWLREGGVSGINLDLMYGLPHQTAESVVDGMVRVLELEPDRLALFGYAHVPWMKKHQQLIPERLLPDPTERVRQLEAATEFLENNGYVAIGIDHFAKPDDDLVKAQQHGRLHRNFQGYTTDEASTLIGLGASAIGSLPQGYVQNAAAVARYLELVGSGKPAISRGVALDDDDRLRRAIIERLMCDFHVDIETIEKKCGMEGNDFSEELARIDALAVDGIVNRDGKTITLPKNARQLVRHVCAVFDRYFAVTANSYSKAL